MGKATRVKHRWCMHGYWAKNITILRATYEIEGQEDRLVCERPFIGELPGDGPERDSLTKALLRDMDEGAEWYAVHPEEVTAKVSWENVWAT
jgi:hypothetical protein